MRSACWPGSDLGRRQAGSPGWLTSNTAARMRISEPKVISAYRTVYILNELPMPTRNRTAARKIVIRMVVVTYLPVLAARVEGGIGGIVQHDGLGLVRELVLGHVGRPGRRVGVVQRAGRQPGVEGHPESRPEAAFGDHLLLRAVQGECDEPGVECPGVEVADRLRAEVGPGIEVSQRRSVCEVDPRGGAPARGRIARPGGRYGDQRQQQGLADLHNSRLTALGVVVVISSRRLQAQLLAAFVQRLADLDRVDSLRHQRSPAPPDEPRPRAPA